MLISKLLQVHEIQSDTYQQLTSSKLAAVFLVALCSKYFWRHNPLPMPFWVTDPYAQHQPRIASQQLKSSLFFTHQNAAAESHRWSKMAWPQGKCRLAFINLVDTSYLLGLVLSLMRLLNLIMETVSHSNLVSQKIHRRCCILKNLIAVLLPMILQPTVVQIPTEQKCLSPSITTSFAQVCFRRDSC